MAWGHRVNWGAGDGDEPGREGDEGACRDGAAPGAGAGPEPGVGRGAPAPELELVPENRVPVRGLRLESERGARGWSTGAGSGTGPGEPGVGAGLGPGVEEERSGLEHLRRELERVPEPEAG